jgi:hypothetical protein
MSKITAANLNNLLEEKPEAPDFVAQMSAVAQAVLDGEEVDAERLHDCALIILSGTTRTNAHKVCFQAFDKLEKDHPQLYSTLNQNLAENLQSNIKSKQYIKAKAYTLAAKHTEFDNTPQGITQKWAVLDTLNDIASDYSLDDKLRVQAFTASFTQSAAEGDQATSRAIRAVNKEVAYEYNCTPMIVNALAGYINNPKTNVLEYLKTKPKSVEQAALLMSFNAGCIDLITKKEISSTEEAAVLLKDKAESDLSLKNLKTINPKACAKGKLYGEDYVCSFGLKSKIAETARDFPEIKVTQYKVPGGSIYKLSAPMPRG